MRGVQYEANPEDLLLLESIRTVGKQLCEQ